MYFGYLKKSTQAQIQVDGIVLEWVTENRFLGGRQ